MNQETKKNIQAILSDINSLNLDYSYRSECAPPPSTDVEGILGRIKYLMFGELHPLHTSAPIGQEETAEQLFELINRCLIRYLSEANAEGMTWEIMTSIPSVKEKLIRDAIAIYDGDPAAHSVEEIILCYPGFLAVTVYRIAQLFYRRNIPYLPRMMTELAHRTTGIDIHPGATIGESFCIDHGTGIVIGETAEIGNGVKIYQGVTIGAKSFVSDGTGRLIKGGKRHPTIGNNCIIYAGTTILGGDTKIGDGSVIGGNVWLTYSVPENSRVYYKEK